METNPYQAPESDPDADLVDDSDPEALRQRFLSHERSIRLTGLLYLASAMLLGFVGLVGAFESSETNEWLVALAMLLSAPVFFALAAGLLKLRRWTRVPVVALSCLGLLAVPVGTFINGYILYLILGRKGRYVLSQDYAEVIAATPNIQSSGPSRVIRLLFWFLVIVIAVIGIVVAIPSG